MMLFKGFRHKLYGNVIPMMTRSISARITDDRYITLHDKKTEMKFPGVWLRDNCTCPKCFHKTSQSRAIDWDHFDVNVRPVQLEVDATNQQINVAWSDAHKSSYMIDWLRARDFNKASRETYLEYFYRPRTVHWSGKEFPNITKRRFQFDDVMGTDNTLSSWLEALAVHGVALIENAPLEQHVVRQLAERVGFIRRTTYGEEFIVQAKPDAKNYAYLSTPLPLHTDLPYYEYKPSVNILHCIVQTESKGGSNLLVDGYHIADILRAKDVTAFHKLTETLVDWNDIGSENDRSFHNIWRAPVICLATDDSCGPYSRINHSIPQRDSHFTVTLEEVQPWYEAYAQFVRLAREDAFAFKLRPGDVLTFNNIRLLHGRMGYDDTEQNSRYIVGAYLDWDIIYSRLRVLKAGAKK